IQPPPEAVRSAFGGGCIAGRDGSAASHRSGRSAGAVATMAVSRPREFIGRADRLLGNRSEEAPDMIPVAKLNHAVLFVRDAEVAAEFYHRLFGFEVVGNEGGGRAIFMRAGNGTNHHDLGLFSVGPNAPRPARGSVGLYHMACEDQS